MLSLLSAPSSQTSPSLNDHDQALSRHKQGGVGVAVATATAVEVTYDEPTAILETTGPIPEGYLEIVDLAPWWESCDGH